MYQGQSRSASGIPSHIKNSAASPLISRDISSRYTTRLRRRGGTLGTTGCCLSSKSNNYCSVLYCRKGNLTFTWVWVSCNVCLPTAYYTFTWKGVAVVVIIPLEGSPNWRCKLWFLALMEQNAFLGLSLSVKSFCMKQEACSLRINDCMSRTSTPIPWLNGKRR